jgi:hypothetical protein
VFRTPFSDVRLLGRVIARRRWRSAGVAAHLANGAAFGMVFERLGGHGREQAVLVAEIENLALWPGFVVADKFHPDRRSGAWPPLLRNPRIFGQEVAAHAVFGLVLGSFVRSRAAVRG